MGGWSVPPFPILLNPNLINCHINELHLTLPGYSCPKGTVSQQTLKRLWHETFKLDLKRRWIFIYNIINCIFFFYVPNALHHFLSISTPFLLLVLFAKSPHLSPSLSPPPPPHLHPLPLDTWQSLCMPRCRHYPTLIVFRCYSCQHNHKYYHHHVFILLTDHVSIYSTYIRLGIPRVLIYIPHDIPRSFIYISIDIPCLYTYTLHPSWQTTFLETSVMTYHLSL